MGDKMGRVHLGRQDLSELQTRKMKGLKRARGLDEEEQGLGPEQAISDDERAVSGDDEVRKSKILKR